MLNPEFHNSDSAVSFKTFPDKELLEKSSKLLVRMSEAVYSLPETPKTIDSWKPLDGYRILEDGSGQPRATIYKHPVNDEYAVVFKGSVSFVDWIADFSYKEVPFIPHKYQGRSGAGTPVHVGFNFLYNKIHSKRSMADTLFRFIEETSIDRLYISGHSLGGALGKLFLYDLMISLEDNKFPEILTVTFGSPKIGWWETAQDFKALYQHLTAKGKRINYVSEYIVHDIVPDLPPIPYTFSGESLALHSGNPIQHQIESYKEYTYKYFDHGERNFRVERNGSVISLVDGLLSWSGKNIIDLVPGYNHLSDIFPRVDTIQMVIDPGLWYDYTINIYGGANSHFKTSHLKFHYEDGSTESKSIFSYRKHWQTVWQNRGKIVRVDFYENYDPTLSEEDLSQDQSDPNCHSTG